MDPRHSADASSRTEGTPVRVADWTVADLIDLEYYLDADERELRERPSSRKTLAERDRSLYLERIEPELGGETPHTPRHRRLSLRLWLRARRHDEDPRLRPLLPGLVFAQAQRLGVWILTALGFLFGISLASALLSYDGHLPVSVPWFVFLLVVVQFVLSVGVIWTWLRRSLRHRQAGAEESWLLSHLIQPALERVAHWFQEQHLARSPQEIRERALSTKGLVRAHFSVYGPLSILTLLIPVQVFGVAFNLGVILTTLVLEWFTDIAFGWGTSLAAHPQTIYDLVRLIAMPWGWLFGEGVGYPTLEQIEGSRIYLEQWTAAAGLKPNPEHLRSWRWFLVLAVFTYGLLPRLLLLGGSLLAQRLTLARLTFTHGRLQALYARMLTPHLDTQAGESGQGSEMPIPPQITPGRVRAGLVGPLKRPDRSPVSRRPWRDELPNRGEKTPIEEQTVETASHTTPPPALPVVEPPARDDSTITPEPLTTPELTPEVVPVPEPVTSHIEAEIPATEDSAWRSASGSTPAPDLQQEPGQAAELEPELEAEPKAPGVAPEQESEPEPETQSGSEAASTQGPEPELQATPEPEPESRAKAKPGPLLESESAAEPGAEPRPETPAEPVSLPEPPPSVPAPPAVPRAGATVYGPDVCLLLIHVDVDDVLEPEDRPRLEQLLRDLSGWRVGAQATFGAGSQMTLHALSLIEEGDWQAPPPRIAVIQDGSQPPITENLVFLRELRAAAGPKAQMLLALVGDPDEDDRLPPLRAFDYRDWQAKIDQLADPYLRLEMLNPPTEDGAD
ncbi:MAG: DUF2868 domain-containing protein [Thermochromatium sp.]